MVVVEVGVGAGVGGVVVLVCEKNGLCDADCLDPLACGSTWAFGHVFRECSLTYSVLNCCSVAPGMVFRMVS